MSISNNPPQDIDQLLKQCERSLLPFVDQDFIEKNQHLLKKYTDEQILDIFKLCLIKPAAKSWAPVWQVLLILFQSAFSTSFTSDQERFMKLGNYLIHKIPDDSKPIIYSFGIGSDITFDRAAVSHFNVPIYMYDPTPGVSVFMEQYADDSNLKFTNEGVYREDTSTKLFLSSQAGKLNSSLYPIHGKDGEYVTIRCRTLKDFMEINGHTSLDILKMDIEGVADDVMHQFLDETDIRPKQIVTELEVKGIENPIIYLPKLLDLMTKLKDNGYIIYNQLLTRKASIELILVHQTLFDQY